MNTGHLQKKRHRKTAFMSILFAWVLRRDMHELSGTRCCKVDGKWRCDRIFVHRRSLSSKVLVLGWRSVQWGDVFSLFSLWLYANVKIQGNPHVALALVSVALAWGLSCIGIPNLERQDRVAALGLDAVWWTRSHLSFSSSGVSYRWWQGTWKKHMKGSYNHLFFQLYSPHLTHTGGWKAQMNTCLTSRFGSESRRHDP